MRMFYCNKCGKNFFYEWHEGIVYFPAVKVFNRTPIIYFKCPFCNTYSITFLCPKCRAEQHISKVITLEKKGKLFKLTVKCSKCGHREILDYFMENEPVLVTTRFMFITFKLKEPIKQLLSEGIVATMRNRKPEVGEKLLVNGKYPVVVEKVETVTESTISKYTPISGFSSTEDWIKAAKNVHHGSLPKHILLLKLISTG